jgi:uncharacterized membrane-anchored protein YhcB (DUF1043 family)
MRAAVVVLFCCILSQAWANPSPATTTAAPTPPQKPLTYAQLAYKMTREANSLKVVVEEQRQRLEKIEANQADLLKENQSLKLQNDSLNVQLQVLHAERSTQMFIYAALSVLVSVLFGFILAGYVYNKRRRQW